MAKKKIHGLDLLRWVVYVLLVLALGIFVYSFVWGFNIAKETALSGLQISADTGTTTKCAEGEMVYGIHNYPLSSVPKEAGAHSKYLDKMPSGNWKCSNICAPADINKFADVLSKLTVGGQKMNVVAGKTEFDALVSKSNGKNELLDRTMILDVSLQRRGKGCFGPSDDYDNLKGATLAKENTTAEDQRKAEEERQKKAEEEKRKKAEEKASGGTGSGGTEPSGGTAAGGSEKEFKAPSGGSGTTTQNTSPEAKAVERCIADLKTLYQKATNYPDLQKNINLSIQAVNIILEENISKPGELEVLATSCKKAYEDYQAKLSSGGSSKQADSQDYLVTINIYGNVAFSPKQLAADGTVAKSYGTTHICVAFNRNPKNTCKKITTKQSGGSFDISLSTTKKELEEMTNTGAGINFYAVNVGSAASSARNYLASYDFRTLGVPDNITNSVFQLQVSDKPIVLQGTRKSVNERAQQATKIFGLDCKNQPASKTIK